MDIGGSNNEFIYIPMEFGTSAGVVRYNRDTGLSTTLMGGNGSGVYNSNPDTWSVTNDDFGSIDPAVITPPTDWLLRKNGPVMVACSKSVIQIVQPVPVIPR